MLSTYARIYIGLSPALVGKIKKYSRHYPSAASESAALPINILPENQIEQAFNHPQCSGLKTFIQTAYRDNIKTDNGINEIQTSLEEQRIFIESTLYTLQNAKKSSSEASKARIESAMDTLNKQLLIMNTIQSDINKSQDQSEDLKNEFDELTQRQDAQWDAFREKQLKALHHAVDDVLAKAGLPELDTIPGGEADNLLRQDLQEVLDRYTDLAAKDLSPQEMEQMLDLKNPDIDTYFKMKAYLAIRSRNPKLEDRPRLMRELANFFSQTKLEGQQLLEKHKQEIQSLAVNKVKPVLQTVESRQKELHRLAEDRMALLAPVTTDKLQQEINERVQQRTQATLVPKAGR